MRPLAITLPRSGIREIMDLAARLGPGSIRLETGQPSHPTAEHIVAAATRAAMDGHTGYAPNAGIPQLREAIAAGLYRRYGMLVGADRVLVTAGGTQGLHLVIATLAGAGDEVLVPSPGWPNYAMMTILQGAHPRAYPLHSTNGFVPRIADLEALVTPQTRVLMLNSPSNPLGVVLTEGVIGDLLRFAARHDIWVVSDECYDEVIFDAPFASPTALDREGRTIGVYSFSKTYAMTGWRVGYVVVPEQLASTMTVLQEPLVSSVNTPAQWAALAALTGPQDLVEVMRADYSECRRTGLAICRAAGLPVHPPDGAFYLWIDISAANLASRQFVIELAEESRVTVAPGTAFGDGGAGYVRVSLAARPEVFDTGLTRLVQFWCRRAMGHHGSAQPRAGV